MDGFINTICCKLSKSDRVLLVLDSLSSNRDQLSSAQLGIDTVDDHIDNLFSLLMFHGLYIYTIAYAIKGEQDAVY